MGKIAWGLIGGGEGSQIGFTHMAAAEIDRKFRLSAGALDIDPVKGKDYAISLGLDPDRAYGSWQEMLAGERNRPDRCKIVTVATPNKTHFEICKAFLEAGFHVLCEKPLTVTLEDADRLVEIAKKSRRICAVNYGYSGYPLITQIRSMISSGELGHIRVIKTEFAGGFMADASDMDNPRVRWRFDPKHAGVSAVTIDCGIHALHLACYVTGQSVTRVSSDFVPGIEGLELENDNSSAFRMSGGTVGRLWTSGLAIGRTHGLGIQVFGEQGGLRWTQEQPNQLYWTPLNSPTRILERGDTNLAPATQLRNHITIGHAEGFPLAVANIYASIAQAIDELDAGREIENITVGYPTVEDGVHSLKIVHAMAKSAKSDSIWIDVEK